MRASRILFILFLIVFNAACEEQATRDDVVLFSVKPLQLVVQSMTEGVVETALLSPDSHSAHELSLGFSQQRLLRQSRALIWMGPSFEAYLARALPTGHTAFAMPVQHANDHIWLDPYRMQMVSVQLVSFLSEIKPASAKTIQLRGQQQQVMLQQLDRDLAVKLAALKGRKVLSGHGGIEALLQRYGIELAASLDSAAHSGLSLQKASEYRAMVSSGGLNCLILEHSEKENKLVALFEALPIRIVKLDLLAADYQSYPAYMHALADALLQCRP